MECECQNGRDAETLKNGSMYSLIFAFIVPQHHLVSLSESINAVRWDEVVDRLISRTSQLTQNAASAVGNAASSASSSGSSSGSDLANKAEHLSLRTAEDVKAKIEQAAHAVQDGPSASLR